MRSRRHVVLALAAGLGLAAGAPAEEPAEQGHDATMEAWMRAGTPGEPHEFLQKMAGEWTTRSAHYRNGKRTATGEGTATFEVLLGGRCVLGRHRGTMWGQPFEGLSLDGYDNISGEYWSTWIDNMSTQIYVSRGRMLEDGRTLEHRGTMTDPAGNEGLMRFVTTRDSDDQFTMKGYVRYAGSEEEQLTLEVVYTRAGS